MFFLFIEIKTQHIPGLQIKSVQILTDLLFAFFIIPWSTPYLQLNDILFSQVINDHISYIARKTSKECVESIEVPLNNTAKAILSKYKDVLCDDRLLPFISPQKYNDCIKMIFLLCGLTRNVTIWNSTTGREEQHPLNELASSHLARRTFIGNLYKKVQDPNMIGKLSGHVEGSRAFARYRTIDDDMKKSLVSMLE